MRYERTGTVFGVAGGLLLVGAIALGLSSLAVGAIALLGLGVATFGLTGSRPVRGRLGRVALRTAALGLAGFTLSALVIDGFHPSLPILDLVLILAVLAGIPVTAFGSILIGAAALSTIIGVRRPAEDGDDSSGRRERHVRRGSAAFASAFVLLGLSGYTAYVGAVGSDQLAHPTGNPDCRTPLVRYGWMYEAINYNIADDAVLQRENPDMTNCSSQGAAAGTDVVTSDGIPIAGWYVPAANGVGPTGPTVVLVHGWDADKSEVLKYAVPLHATFNVVAFDERDGGRSGQANSSFGLHEKLDIEAIIDWLERTKHPAHLALMGNSMGGGAAALAAAGDPRIEALVLDSTHAHVSNVLETRLEVDAGGHPGLPGTPAIIAGFWLRTGVDLMQADPITAIPALGKRPLLLIHGAADVNDVPALSVDLMDQKALDSGVPVELHMCPGATHGKVIDTCPTEWGQWAVAFLNRAFNLPA